MADIELVIKISEKQYEIIKELVKKQNSICPEANSAEKIILNGTPLPKGHGRLIDADMLKEYHARVVNDTDLGRLHTVDVKDIDNAPTIIEVDKEEEE